MLFLVDRLQYLRVFPETYLQETCARLHFLTLFWRQTTTFLGIIYLFYTFIKCVKFTKEWIFIN
jgi:hypothetical protein